MNLIELIVLGVIMAGIIYFFVSNRKPADVIPIDLEERRAFNKAREDLEKGVEEAKTKYLAKRMEYDKVREEMLKKQQERLKLVKEDNSNGPKQ